ncbi:MAG TPA: glycoside hydrolase family 2 protein [Candidatus Limnocylindrales bacterium]|nr:glycoside hydrolase family 2 protein [Candidatus Limnocylindrales bacterium]
MQLDASLNLRRITLPRARSAFLLIAACAQVAAATDPVQLRDGWRIQSSAKVTAGGEQLSRPGFNSLQWYPATMPSTVIAALVRDKVYPDPYFGMNLRDIPGTTYNIGANFANVAMPAGSPYAVPWWFRTEFTVPAQKGRHWWLHFDSINYRANIWVNGKRVAEANTVQGMYRMWEFDVTDALAPGRNALAVEVFPPQPDEFTITFVDWNPMPADKDMGLVRDVYLTDSGPVTLRHLQAVSKLNESMDRATVTEYADLTNVTAAPIDVTLRARIDQARVSKKVHLEPHQTLAVAAPAIEIANPKLWWPYGMGRQDMYEATADVVAGAQVSDSARVEFGIREVTGDKDAQDHRVFTINRKKILIRGGGWSPDMLLRRDDEREEREIRYARDMHLNTIRLEGKMMDRHFYETADRLGMLVMPGWCCCSYWERWKTWKPEDYEIAGESLRDQLRLLRNHPSVFVFLYGSDESPNEQAERTYLKVLEDERWPNPSISSAADRKTGITGRTGVKMTGPYDYVAPEYWLEDTKHGGAYGFNTETSPGPAIPLLASLKEMLPPEHLWPIDEFWNFHAGGGSYKNVNIFSKALDERYGKVTGLEDFVNKSQLATYEGERAMFEAYGRNKYTATGVIQWMLNNAWPSTIWHLYDWYLRPGGGYFGTKKANEPLHVQYSYDDRSVVVVNSQYRSFHGYSVSAKAYNLDLTEKFSKTAPVVIPEDGVVRVFTIPEIEGLSKTYFLRVQLRDEAGKLASTNFYWLSTQPDVSEFDRSNGRSTPIKTYADLTGLANLTPVEVKVASHGELRNDDRIEHVTVTNPSKGLAFFVHLTVMKGQGGTDIKPIYWEDNYFELFPGETREVSASYPAKLLGTAKPYIAVDGWNARRAR